MNPQRIMFWSGWAGSRPQDHVRFDVPQDLRDHVASVMARGNVVERWMGLAACRMCSAQLGSRDFGGHGFIWPEMAEHYVLQHRVWTPGCTALFTASKRSLALNQPTLAE